MLTCCSYLVGQPSDGQVAGKLEIGTAGHGVSTAQLDGVVYFDGGLGMADLKVDAGLVASLSRGQADHALPGGRCSQQLSHRHGGQWTLVELHNVKLKVAENRVFILECKVYQFAGFSFDTFSKHLTKTILNFFVRFPAILLSDQGAS